MSSDFQVRGKVMTVSAAPKAKTPSQDRGQRRVDLLLDAAAELILVHGAEGLKMDMVAKQAATSPGSLYQFFPNRAALLTALMERFGAQLSALAQQIVEQQSQERPADLAVAARSFLAPFLDFYARNQAYVILAEASERLFAGQGYTFFEDDVVAQSMVQVLTPFTAAAQKPRLARVAKMLTIQAHTAIAAAFDVPEDERADWLGELDRLIQSYIATLQES